MATVHSVLGSAVSRHVRATVVNKRNSIINVQTACTEHTAWLCNSIYLDYFKLLLQDVQHLKDARVQLPHGKYTCHHLRDIDHAILMSHIGHSSSSVQRLQILSESQAY